MNGEKEREEKGREGVGSILRDGLVCFSWSENKSNVNHVSLLPPKHRARGNQTRLGIIGVSGDPRGVFCEILIASFHMAS